MTGDYISLTGAVLTVICVLFLAYWCSRLLGKRWTSASTGRNIKVLEQLQVGNDRQLMLIKVRSQIYLIGVSAAGIQMLSEIEGDFDETEISEGMVSDLKFFEVLKAQAGLLQKKKRENK